MAKSNRRKNPPLKKRTTKIRRAPLIPGGESISRSADVNVTFISGMGQGTVLLFRKGLLIHMQSLTVSGDVRFADVQQGDAIAVNGVCTGSATITIDIPTRPATPTRFDAGNFNIGYDVL